MKLWRLTRAPFVALDGAGTVQFGGRYSPKGRPVVNLTSEAGLAVLISYRYLPRDLAGVKDDYLLGWTEADAEPLRICTDHGEDVIRREVEQWLDSGEHLLAAVSSRVLPEADIVMMNPLHRDAAEVKPLITRAFSFAECLHHPPMLDHYVASSREEI